MFLVLELGEMDLEKYLKTIFINDNDKKKKVDNHLIELFSNMVNRLSQMHGCK